MIRKRRKLNIKGKLFLVFIFFAAAVLAVYSAYTPILRQTAEAEANRVAQKIITKSVNEACEKNSIDLNLIMDCEKDENGNIKGISSDMAKINLFKEYLLDEVEGSLKNERYKEKIPVGTLLGNSITYGKADIEMTVLLGGYISADIDSEVQSSGINQTKYSIYVTINTKIYTYLPLSNFTVENSTRVFLKEYVIVGAVPSIYTK